MHRDAASVEHAQQPKVIAEISITVYIALASAGSEISSAITTRATLAIDRKGKGPESDQCWTCSYVLAAQTSACDTRFDAERAERKLAFDYEAPCPCPAQTGPVPVQMWAG